MTTDYYYVYSWFVGDEEEMEGEKEIKIRMYCLSTRNETTCIHVEGFCPWFMVEVRFSTPTTTWSTTMDGSLRNSIKERLKPVLTPHELDNIRFQRCSRRRLYMDHEQRQCTLLKLRFCNLQSRKKSFYRLQKWQTRIMGKKLTTVVHEQEASPLLQLWCECGLSSCGWIYLQRFRYIQKILRCQRCERTAECRHELSCSYKSIQEDTHREIVPQPRVMAFDLEVYSSNPSRMPQSENPLDCIFQISCVFESEKHILTLGPSGMSSSAFHVHTYENESDLLRGFRDFVHKYDPHILVGYNIYMFDVPYLIERAKLHGVYSYFRCLGVPPRKKAEEKQVRWSSSAFKNQQFCFLETEGRLMIDLLPIVRRDYKFSNYKLSTVGSYFVNMTKEDLPPQDIFRIYRQFLENQIGLSQIRKDFLICAQYCIQDSNLVFQLFETLQLWIGLTEMARVCHVPLLVLFTQGQQIKVYSQVYKKCMEEGIVVETYDSLQHYEQLQGIAENQSQYVGAYVFPPQPGVYPWVIPFDFSSLYPTTIIAYNIDYSTLVCNPEVPDSECHVIEWQDNPEKTYRIRFRKEPMGILPSLLKTLISQRSLTKKKMKQVPNTTEYIVLDKRQLAYKVSANSMYGAMGVQKGYLPFLPGAMATTAMGRMSIQKAAEFVIQKHHGDLIYGDSVTGRTPILIFQEEGGFSILPIQELYTQFPTQSYPGFLKTGSQKEQSIPDKPLYVWSTEGWSLIKRVIRHKTLKSLFTVSTTQGFIEVTEDHSLLRRDRTLVQPGNVDLQKDLLYHSFPSYEKHRSFYKRVPQYQLDTFSYECGLSSTEKTFCELLHQDNTKVLNVSFIEGCLDAGSLQYTLLEGTIRYSGNSLTEAQCVFLIFQRVLGNSGVLSQQDDHVTVYFPCKETTPPQNCAISLLGSVRENEFVYDIETEDGTFHAGVGSLIVKNTDSIYCHFPGMHTAQEVWKFAKTVEREFITLFPPPMKLVFEEKIYKTFLILTKKRYMAYTCQENGVLDQDMTIRGVLLARRDNCAWIRDVYEETVRAIMSSVDIPDAFETIFFRVLQRVKECLQRNVPFHKFIITKSVGSGYKIRPLPEDVVKCQKRLSELQIRLPCTQQLSVETIRQYNQQLLHDDPVGVVPLWLREYIRKNKPAHVQLAEKMQRRGNRVEIGSRLEYLLIEHSHSTKQYDKVEDPYYQQQHRNLLFIDYAYYVTLLSTPIDQLLEVVYHKKNCLRSFCKTMEHKKKVLQQLRSLTEPRLVFAVTTTSLPLKENPTISLQKPKKKTLYDYL